MKKFEELKQWKQAALKMHVCESKTGAEISRLLGVPERTVQDNIKKLRDRYSFEEIMAYNANGEEPEAPKILFYDIETTLAVSYHFGQWKQNLGIKQQIVESHLLSHCWAWNDGDVEGSILSPKEVLANDDERLVYECWALLDNCDILVAHNAKGFDVRRVNGYFLKYGLPPPSPYKVVDTLQISRRKFGLPFHNLAYLAKFLKVTHKIENSGIELWIECAKGSQSALDEMFDYNKGDITTLRDVYRKLIGWDNDAVNMALYTDTSEMVCPHCSSTNIQMVSDKFVYTAQRKYQLYRCLSCKTPLRGNTKVGVGNYLKRIV